VIGKFATIRLLKTGLLATWELSASVHQPRNIHVSGGQLAWLYKTEVALMQLVVGWQIDCVSDSSLVFVMEYDFVVHIFH